MPKLKGHSTDCEKVHIMPPLEEDILSSYHTKSSLILANVIDSQALFCTFTSNALISVRPAAISYDAKKKKEKRKRNEEGDRSEMARL